MPATDAIKTAKKTDFLKPNMMIKDRNLNNKKEKKSIDFKKRKLGEKKKSQRKKALIEIEEKEKKLQ